MHPNLLSPSAEMSGGWHITDRCWLLFLYPALLPTPCPAALPAHPLQPRAPGQFRYPHFYILGFPKCATTSLYW